MIDSFLRFSFQKKMIFPLLKNAWIQKCHPMQITVLGLIMGLLAAFFLTLHWTLFSFFFLLSSGFCDILDGSLARAQKKTSNQGAVLDIFFDRIVEGAMILGFYFYDPARAFLCLLMLFSILLCITSFLVVALFTENHSEKSFYYSPGLIERTEAFIFFFLLILFPSLFFPLATLFAIMVLFTAIERSLIFYLKQRFPRKLKKNN